MLILCQLHCFEFCHQSYCIPNPTLWLCSWLSLWKIKILMINRLTTRLLPNPSGLSHQREIGIFWPICIKIHRLNYAVWTSQWPHNFHYVCIWHGQFLERTHQIQWYHHRQKYWHKINFGQHSQLGNHICHCTAIFTLSTHCMPCTESLTKYQKMLFFPKTHGIHWQQCHQQRQSTSWIKALFPLYLASSADSPQCC